MYIVLGIDKNGSKFPVLVSAEGKIPVYTTLEEAESVAEDLHNIWRDTVYFAKNILE